MTSFILSKEQFQQFQINFRRESNAGCLSAADMILYNLLRGRDLSRGFTCITNLTKLAHGMDSWLGFKQAIRALKYELNGSVNLRRRFGNMAIQQIIDVLNKTAIAAKEKQERAFKIASKKSDIGSIQMWLDNLDKSIEEKKTQLKKLQSELHQLEDTQQMLNEK